MGKKASPDDSRSSKAGLAASTSTGKRGGGGGGGGGAGSPTTPGGRGASTSTARTPGGVGGEDGNTDSKRRGKKKAPLEDSNEEEGGARRRGGGGGGGDGGRDEADAQGDGGDGAGDGGGFCGFCCGPPMKSITTSGRGASATPSGSNTGDSDSSSATSRTGRKASKKRLKEVPLGAPRDYADVNEDKPESYFDIVNYKIEWGNVEDYKVDGNRLIGEGAYGSVYLAQDSSGKTVVVKTIKPEKEDIVKIQKEVRMLVIVKGGPHIVQFLDMVKDPNTKLKMMVFDYTENPNYKLSFRGFKDRDCKLYFYKLLKAVHHAHSQGIMHRDLKGANVLYNPKNGEVKLIDWGFGEFYRKGRPLTLWPGTRYYKAPELFLHYAYYDYSVDMWSLGCMLASVIFGRNLFMGPDSRAQMEAIARILGTDDYTIYIEKYSKRNSPIYHFPPTYINRYRKLLPTSVAPRRQRLNSNSFINPSNRHLATADAIDLVELMLQWDHEHRITAKEALAHRYFDQVRDTEAPSQDVVSRDDIESTETLSNTVEGNTD